MIRYKMRDINLSNYKYESKSDKDKSVLVAAIKKVLSCWIDDPDESHERDILLKALERVGVK